MNIVTLDGPVVSGPVEQSTDSAITRRPQTNPPNKTVVPGAEIDEMDKSGQSLMPERTLETLNKRQIIELFRHLNST